MIESCIYCGRYIHGLCGLPNHREHGHLISAELHLSPDCNQLKAKGSQIICVSPFIWPCVAMLSDSYSLKAWVYHYIQYFCGMLCEIS